jgi:CheY-like chemotaxis protein
VDDEPMNLMVLEGLLETLQVAQVRKAFNGIHALDVMRECSFDFDYIMTDCHMPQMNGIQLAKEVRMLQDTGFAKEDVRIIVASGERFTEEFDKVIVKGKLRKLFDEELQKPFSFEELEQALYNSTN